MCGRKLLLGVGVVLVPIAMFWGDILKAAFRLNSYPIDEKVGVIEPLSAKDLTGKLQGKDILVVGATRGIGRGVALALAQHGANVGVVGRSESSGKAVVEKMKQIGAKGAKFESYSGDLFTVKGCLKLTDKIKENGKKLDYIVMTVGAWPDFNDQFSADGIDKVIALDLVARYVVVAELEQILNPGARVMSVLASTAKIPYPSLDEVKAMITGETRVSMTGLMTMMTTVGNVGDVFLEEASRVYPHINFIGTHPGIVVTELTMNTFPSWFNGVKTMMTNQVAKGFNLTEETCGEIHAQILASPNAGRKPATFFNFLLEGRGTTTLKDDADFRSWLWTFLQTHVENHK